MDLIKIKELTKEQAYNKCMLSSCNCCELNYKHWCVFKNTHDQIKNNLTKKDYEKYMNNEVYV